jgi:hypothetical protein
MMMVGLPGMWLDLDQGLEFAQVMGITQRMQHARHGVIGLPMVVHHGADDIGQQAAARGCQECGRLGFSWRVRRTLRRSRDVENSVLVEFCRPRHYSSEHAVQTAFPPARELGYPHVDDRSPRWHGGC